jgi:hypothetical protein
LIFANKQDIQMSLSAEEVMELMELNNIMNRMWSIFACSAIKGEGIIRYSDNFIYILLYIILMLN